MPAALVGLAAAGFLALAWLLWRQGRARGPALLIRPAGLEIICQNALGGLRPPQHLGWDQIEAVAARHVARGGRWFRIEPSLEAAVALGLLPPDYRHDGVLFAVRPVLQVPLDRLDHDAAALVGALAGPLAAAGLRLEKSFRFRGLWDEDRWTLVRT
jgi:hypothetical protein